MPQANILLVDDHPENLLTLEAVLAPMDENLVRARSGEEALRYLLTQDFAVILLDVHMQGMTGFETAAMIKDRERSRYTPIIFLTGTDLQNTRIFEGYAAGGVDYLTKPVIGEILRAKVQIFVDLFKKNQQVQEQAARIEAINRELEQQLDHIQQLSHDVDKQKRATEERDLLLAREQAAREQAEKVQRRMVFLAQSSAVLAASLDYQETLKNVAALAVPDIADWCSVHIMAEDGSTKLVAITHKDPDKVSWAYELQQKYPSDRNSPRGVHQVMRTGQPELYSDIPDALLVAGARDQEHLRIMRELGFSSSMVVPLAAHGRIFGGLTFVCAESGFHYNDEDLVFAQELAHHCALAVENSLLYDEVRREREHFRVTLTSIGDAVIATDAQGNVSLMNAVAEKLTGWTLADATGRPLPEVFRIINEESRRTVESPVEKVMREGQIVGLANHTLLIARDGTERPIDDSGAPVRDADGEIVGVILVFRDVTERRHAEEAQHFILEASKVLVSTLDYEVTLNNLAGLIVPRLADRCLIDMSEEDGTVRQVAIVATDPDIEEAIRELRRRYPPDPKTVSTRRVLQSAEPMLISDLSDEFLQRAAQDEQHLELMRTTQATSLMVIPMFARHRTIGTITFAVRESGRRYTEADLSLAEELGRRAALIVDNARLYRDAQQALAMRDEFLSVAAHELRTPVTSLRGFAQLLTKQIDRGDTPDPHRIRRTIETIDQQSEKLTYLVSQLLDISRIRAGRLQLDPKELEIVHLIETIASAARVNTSKHSITVRAASPVSIEGDLIRLEQVMTNLVDNAIKYSPNGGPIDVDITTSASTVQIIVQDQGIGIAPEHRQQIFAPFYQAHVGDHFGGLGLGLYISHQIIELHQGTIRAEFPVEGGTRFIIVLPLTQPKREA
jgi:PAS domain S-box-containing protein